MSETWGGRASDTTITLQSRLVDLLPASDAIMADRGFDIPEAIGPGEVWVNVRSFLGSEKQMPAADVEKPGELLTCIYCRCERVIVRAGRFHILNQVQFQWQI